jgi:hypothetical protein
LVGIIVFEPTVTPGTTVIRNGYFHVATARKAWRTGLVDEAGHLAISEMFKEIPTLLRVSGYMVEKNFPARSLCKRLGFTYEGLIADMFMRDGKPENMVLFGLTRREYECLNSSVESSGVIPPTKIPTPKQETLEPLNQVEVEDQPPTDLVPQPPTSQVIIQTS